MNVRQPQRRGGYGWLAAVGAGVLVAVAGAPSPTWAASGSGAGGGPVRAADQPPDQVINAQTDPQLAGQTLSSGCVVGQDGTLENCTWQADSDITIGYGPRQVVGDALYNCSHDNYAETAVGVSDERGESTSVSESLSVGVSGGLLGLEKVSAKFEVFSKQAEAFSTKVTTTDAIAVPPMWKGWVMARVLTASVSGTAYITRGIHTIAVTGIDLNFPGYRDPKDKSDTSVLWVLYRAPMTPEDTATRCDSFAGIGGPAVLKAIPTGKSTLTLCRVVPVAVTGSIGRAEARRGVSCGAREVTGTAPPTTGLASATLGRHGRVYAAGTDTNGRIRLTLRRPLTAGRYTLTIRQRRHLPARHGRPRAASVLTTVAPIAIR